MKRLSIIFVAVVVLLAACTNGSPSVTPVALSVGGTTLSLAELEAELEWLEANPSVAERLLVQSDPTGMGPPQPLELRGEAPGAWNPAAGAQMLSIHVQAVIFERALANLDGEVSEEDRSAAEAGVGELVGTMDPATGQVSPGSTDDMPESLRDVLIAVLASNTALERVAFDVEQAQPGDEAIEARFDELIAQQSTQALCSSHILFAFDPDQLGAGAEPTEAQEAAALEAAEATLAELEAGADFAELATERSDDTGSAMAGGELGCVGPGQFVVEFEEALVGLDEGELSEPVRTAFGYHLIRRDALELPTLDELRPQIVEELSFEAAGEAIEQAFTDAVDGLDVDVDPRFGTWDGEQFSVVPPEGSAPAPVAPVPTPDDAGEFDLELFAP